METNRLKNVGPTGSPVVVAVFGHTKSVSDAIADLTYAGFGKRQIRVAFARSGRQNLKDNTVASHKDTAANLGKEHSLRWKLRQIFEHDLHRSGENQLARKDRTSFSSELKDMCSHVDLQETLASLCAKEDRVRLLHSEIRPGGALVVVDAHDRWREAESILERVAGIIRTDTATEGPPFIG